jgi:branched-subunit amino acid transport protein AzlD
MVQEIIVLITSIIGGATIILRALKPFIKSTAPDNILRYLEKVLEVCALDSEASKQLDEITIKIKEK